MSDSEKNVVAAEEENTPATETAIEAKKTDKPVKKAEKKPSVFKRIAKWMRDLRSEAKKVVWPTSKQVVNNTVIVLICVIVVAIFVALLDSSFGFVRDLIARLV